MRRLVFQHRAEEPPAAFGARDWLGNEAAAWDFARRAEAQSDQLIVLSRSLYANFRSLC